MNLKPGLVLLDVKHYNATGRIRELLIDSIDGDNIHVTTLSGQPSAKVQPSRYFGNSTEWTLQGHWNADPTAPIPPITAPLDDYEMNRLQYRKASLKMTNTARIENSLMPSLEPTVWYPMSSSFQRLATQALRAADLHVDVRYLDFHYARNGGLRRLIYRRRGTQWLLVRTLITPEEIAYRRILR